MLTSLPNTDRTFTGNLFIPLSIFKKKKCHISFFKQHFPDFLQLVGEEKLLEQMAKQELQPLISIKVEFIILLIPLSNIA